MISDVMCTTARKALHPIVISSPGSIKTVGTSVTSSASSPEPLPHPPRRKASAVMCARVGVATSDLPDDATFYAAHRPPSAPSWARVLSPCIKPQRLARRPPSEVRGLLIDQATNDTITSTSLHGFWISDAQDECASQYRGDFDTFCDLVLYFLLFHIEIRVLIRILVVYRQTYKEPKAAHYP